MPVETLVQVTVVGPALEELLPPPPVLLEPPPELEEPPPPLELELLSLDWLEPPPPLLLELAVLLELPLPPGLESLLELLLVEPPPLPSTCGVQAVSRAATPMLKTFKLPWEIGKRLFGSPGVIG